MEKLKNGYWHIETAELPAGTGYMYTVDGKTPRPDPASFYQPQGVHGCSELYDHNRFKWTDTEWKGVELGEMIAYELHVGTFTSEGTFDSAVGKIGYLKELGINAVELMPVAQFPGRRNWGYDGAYPFGVQNSYGGPEGLKRFVDACHGAGLAVILDAVYNHLGPEGNYLENFGPYFTAKYNTPWGKAVNYDDAYCCGVRNYVVKNMAYWFNHFHADALRLDAIHGIFDEGAKHILLELSENKETLENELGRKLYLIAESDLNDPKTVKSPSIGGHGMDSQWLDDFHHSVHTLITGENGGYYADFGAVELLKKSIEKGFVYDGIYSNFRRRDFGGPSSGFSGERFIVFAQNHDQVGNRLMGERLSALTDFESLKLAAGCVLLSPYIPMLFMGEEYGDKSPFMYFIEHGDKGLVDAVRNGRKTEFEHFARKGDIPDPQSEETFALSKLKWEKLKDTEKIKLLSFYKKLIALRKMLPAYKKLDKNGLSVTIEKDTKVLSVRIGPEESAIMYLMNFADSQAVLSPQTGGSVYTKILDSAGVEWGGAGAGLPELLSGGTKCLMPARSIALYSLN